MCQDRTDDMLETHFTCKGKKYPVIGLTGGVGAGKKYGVVHSSGKIWFSCDPGRSCCKSSYGTGKRGL